MAAGQPALARKLGILVSVEELEKQVAGLDSSIVQLRDRLQPAIIEKPATPGGCPKEARMASNLGGRVDALIDSIRHSTERIHEITESVDL